MNNSSATMTGQNHVRLRWTSHQGTILSIFEALLSTESLTDVAFMTSDGNLLHAHKLILSACSPYFQKLFTNPLFSDVKKESVIFLKDVKCEDLKLLIDYMYRGEISLRQSEVEGFISLAKSLEIRGLSINSPNVSRSSGKESELISHRSETIIFPTTKQRNDRSPTRPSGVVGSRSQRKTSASSGAKSPAIIPSVSITHSSNPSTSRIQTVHTEPKIVHRSSVGKSGKNSQVVLHQKSQHPKIGLTTSSTPNNKPVNITVQPNMSILLNEYEESYNDEGETSKSSKNELYTSPESILKRDPVYVDIADEEESKSPIQEQQYLENNEGSGAVEERWESMQGEDSEENEMFIEENYIEQLTGNEAFTALKPRRAQGELKYSCDVCGHAYQTRGSLIRHKKYECNKAPMFQCATCNIRFKYRFQANVHQRTCKGVLYENPD